MTRRGWIILGCSGLLLIIIGFFAVQWWQQRVVKQAAQSTQAATDQANAQQVQSILASPFEKLQFMTRVSGGADLYIADVADGTTGRLENNASLIYSNVLPASQTWYEVNNQTLIQHTALASTELGQLAVPVSMADALGAQASLAVDAANEYMAWVTTDNSGVESIHVFTIATKTDTTLYTGEPRLHYSNLTWSPDASELAFTANSTRLISVTRAAGAEINNRITLPFGQINYLTWLDRDHFGCVLTSTDTNPNPFEPIVTVFDRAGAITEQHAVFEKIGIPKVIWSEDGTEFLFHDPWKNLFFIYNRYDQPQGSINVKAPGKLTPFGWLTGLKNRTAVTANNSTTTVTTITPTTTEPFTVTAEDWERYNTTARAILKQFKIDFSSYRFATTDQGLEMNFSLTPEIAEPEIAIGQTIAQLFTLLPNIPAIALHVTMADGSVINVPYVSSATVSTLVENYTEKTLADLFIINKQNPFGKRAMKDDNTGHHYIGDLVYSQFGDYNPLPMLAQLNATFENYPLTDSLAATMQFYKTDAISFLYPTTWSTKTIDDQTTLFYTSETTFASATAWLDFGVTLKRYTAPGVTLEQWLSVNRSDSPVEDLPFELHQPLTGQHVITGNNYSDEYVVLLDNAAYVLRVERTADLTAADKLYLATMINTFSDNYAFQRN